MTAVPADRYRAGIDIGGTFTDVVVAGGGTHRAAKVLSTPDDYGRGIVAGLGEALDALGAAPGAVDRVVHGTTVATNAILERKGAVTGLVTTEGFRDVLEMRRLRIPEMYALNYPRPEPLVPRRRRLEVRERLGPRGEVRIPLDEASVLRARDALAAAGVEAVAVSLIHAYANRAHERRIADLLSEGLPGVFITCSSDILPVIREYERTSTTVINAYLGPAVRRYFESLRRHLAEIGIEAPLQVMKSDGGTMTAAAAAERPAYIVESGPAAGVIGAARTMGGAGGGDCVTFDMGGTTAKAAIVEGGAVAKSTDYEVGAGINLSSKLVMGGGYALKLPVVDVSEIGAGGGSIVSVDAGGLLHVGPESAGAVPGPVAYGAGGRNPTFTDALVVLGYLNPTHLAGGRLALDAPGAAAALRARVAEPLAKDPLDAAFGIFQVACATMVRAIKAVSTYRGRDPRDFTLFAFGGNGPVVAAECAGLLEMRSVQVPPDPGVFSARGLLLADISHETSRAFFARLGETTPAVLAARYAPLEREMEVLMAREGYPAGAYETVRLADLRYSGQAHELTVRCDYDGDTPDLAGLARAFAAEHARTYGHAAGAEAVECVTLRVQGRIASTEEIAALPPAPRTAPAAPATRSAFFGPRHGRLETPVLARADLGAVGQAGPAIIEEFDATCVVPPGWRACLDDLGNIRLSTT